MKIAAIHIIGDNRRQVSPTTKPAFAFFAAGIEITRVHMNSRNVRIAHMRDQRNTTGPETRVFLGTGDLATESITEGAVNGGNIDTDLLKDLSVHDRHNAAATLVALPGFTFEASCASSLRWAAT